MNQMEKVIPLYKILGETPLQCMKRFQDAFPEYKNVQMTYAGRLDPMAEGLQICLAGDECFKKDQYIGLDKEYLFEILVGVSTDTHDLLGLIEEQNMKRGNGDDIIDELKKDLKSEDLCQADLERVFKDFTGEYEQKYPAYSSRTVNGIHLHALARAGRLPSIEEIPGQMVRVYNLGFFDSKDENEKRYSPVIRKISGENLFDDICRRIAKVGGDFRQKEIIEKWKKFLTENDIAKNRNFSILKCQMKCSSGTYVRGLIRDIATKMGVPMCAYSIKRLSVGKWML